MQELLTRLADGEEAAFAELYDDFAPRLYRYLLSRLHSRDAADEVLQEVFVRLVRSRESLRDVRHLVAYLFGVARHESLRQAKIAQRHDRARSLEAGAVCHRSTDPHAAHETEDEIAGALAQLSDVQREVVELKIFGELTLAEIATALDTPPGTIATRYRTALARMRAWLTERDRNVDDKSRRS